MITELLIDLLQKGHAVQFQARGDSMDPLIRDRDYLHVEPCDSFRVGDVVLVLAERGLTAHRVVSLRDGVVVTRGDNAPAADDAVPVGKVLGKVTAIVRDGHKTEIGPIGLIGRIRRIYRSYRSYRSYSS
jgi:signal peptidase I